MDRQGERIIPRELTRTLGFIDAVAIGLGAIIGAGIFVIIGPAVAVAGVWTLIGIGIAAFVALFNALSSAQLAAAFPVSGGTYAYARRLLHPLAGLEFNI